MRSDPRVPAALLLAVLAISFAAIFFRFAAPTHPLVAAGIRLVIAAALLLPFALRGHRRGHLDRRLLLAATGAGLFYGLHFGAWVWSLQYTTVAAATTLVTATPLLLALWSVAEGRDRPDRRLWLALGLAAVGVTTIGGTSLGGSSQALLGDGLALLGCAAMGGYMLLARRVDPPDILAYSAVAVAVGGVCLLGTAAALGVPLRPASNAAFGWLVMAALVPQLVGHTLLTWCLRHAPPVAVGMATVGEPVGSTLLAWWLLAELPPGRILVGCAITASAVLLSLRRAAPGTASVDPGAG